MREPSFGEIANAIRVVAYFNEPLEELANSFEAHHSDATAARRKIRDAVSAGSGVFEALEKFAPKFATAIHDFSYLVIYPNSSITTRDITCEKLAKVILSL